MIGWLDCSAGVSGDMLLGALVDAGAPLEVLQQAVDALRVEPVRLRTEQVVRAGIGALRVHVQVSPEPGHRNWADIRALLERALLTDPVRRTALDVFARLASAEAAVHRVPPEEVHFHEVGALDALADVVGAAAGFHALGLTGLSASAVAVGSGVTRGMHGPLPVPAPAVLALLAGVPVHAGSVPHESTTPTGAAVLATLVSTWGPLPALVLQRTGVGAGGRDPVEAANVLRLVLGEPVETPPIDGATLPAPPGLSGTVTTANVLLATNVDDLDPRIWPGVLDRLLAAGAADAWLTPILMKKGRPAYTLSVLCPASLASAMRDVVFRNTSAIGLREHAVTKTALQRREDTVSVDGVTIRVKRALLTGDVVNSQPEWDDVAAAALALGQPAKTVLARASAAAHTSAAACPDPAPEQPAGPGPKDTGPAGTC